MTTRMLRSGLAAFVLTASLLVQATTGTAADKISTDRLLPENVAVYVTVPDVSALTTRWEESLYGEMQSDPAFDGFWEQLKEPIADFSRELKANVGVTLDDLLQLPSGEISLAVVQPTGKPLAVVGFLDYGENADTIETLLEQAESSFADRDVARSTQEIDDTTVVIYTMKAEVDDDDPAARPSPDRHLAYFQRDNFIVVSSSPVVLESVLTRWSGEHPRTFASNEAYGYIIERCKSENAQSLLTWYVDLIGLIKGAVASLDEPNLQAQMVLGFLPTLGVTNLKAFGGTLDLATSEYDTVSRTMIYVDRPTSGLLNVFQFPGIEQSPPKWVSAQTSNYYSLNWDIASAYDAVEVIVDTFQGPGTLAALVDSLADQPDGPKLHVKKDLVDQLSGRIQVAIEESDTDDIGNGPVIVALGIKDADKMKSTLSSIANTPGFPGTTRQFLGETIYEVPAAARPDGTQELVTFAITNGNMMLTNTVTILERVIRGTSTEKSLADTDDYRNIAAHFPAKTSIIAYQKQDAQVRTAYEMLRSGAVGDQVGGQIDFRKLPPFETVEKYLRPSGSYVVPDSKGVLMVSFSLPQR